MTETQSWERVVECGECQGTGLYRGMAERDKFAVQCHACKGEGKKTLRVTWKEFEGRKRREDVERVVQVNPGYVVGVSAEHGLGLESFGGLSYSDWLAGVEFAPGTEMRGHVCPAWWYQSADYERKPSWKECGFGTFPGCEHFANKAACWARWDEEFGSE